jgi:prepilin-type N-terminal cleavage/methylation domain-containing protein
MATHRDPRSDGFTLLEVLFAVLVVAVIAVIVVPGLLHRSRGHHRELNFSTSLKTLASAEADFRSNDRDCNHANDFWTADVKGLYTMTNAAVVGGTPNSTTDPSIKLIELSVASADADGTFFPAGGENLALTNFALPSAKAGYWFAALRADLSTTPQTPYAQDTLGQPDMGKVHHDSKFGFVAFPDSPSSGNYVCIVNENNTIFRMAATVSCRSGSANPPGLGGVSAASLNWPDEKTLKAHWTKLD